MAVTFKNPQQYAHAYPRQKAEARAKKSITQTKKEELHAKKLLAFWEARSEVDAELRASLDKLHIPQTIEMGIKTGRISAQEIIETVQTMYNCTLGPLERRWIVANIISRDMFAGRSPDSQKYCPEVAQYIIERMCQGEPLRSVCRDPSMPFISRFLVWVIENPDLQEQYNRAKEIAAMSMAEDIPHIVDDARMGVTLYHKADGTVEIQTVDMLGRSKLQYEARKWIISKILHNTYGTVEAELEGGDNTVHVKVTGGLPDGLAGQLMTPEQRKAHDDAQYAAVNGNKSVNGGLELGKGLTVEGGLPGGQGGLPANPWDNPIPTADA
jgi:hypothetical protein